MEWILSKNEVDLFCSFVKKTHILIKKTEHIVQII